AQLSCTGYGYPLISPDWWIRKNVPACHKLVPGRIGSCPERGYSGRSIYGRRGGLVNSAVFGAITATTLSIAAALAGCFAASQIVLRPMLEADNATLAR